MTNEEYARRYMAILEKARRWWPEPAGDWDSNQYEWEDWYRRHQRVERRIRSLPERWRKLPRLPSS